MIRDLLLTKENHNTIAVITGEKQVLLGEVVRKAVTLQKKLPKKKREHIVIFLPNSSEYIAALFGIYMAGMTAFPLNSYLTRYEVIPLLKQVSAFAVVTSGIYREFFEEIKEEMETVEVIYLDELPEPEGSLFPAIKAVDADEPMLLLATSGTTGKAKIVQLSEKNFEHSILAYIDKMDFETMPVDEMKFVLATPFSAIYGLMVLTACLIKSIPIVVMKDEFTLDMFYKTVEQHRITHYEGGVSVGLLMERMAGRSISCNIKSLRYVGLAGSKITSASLVRLIEYYPWIAFWPGYGMTEASPLIAKHAKNVRADKLDSVGTASKGVIIKLDADGILTDCPEVRGEIAVKGPNVMLGYFENEEETCKVIKNGYLHTGDIGYLDEDGYLYICGRKKNVIMSRGYSVYAEEVEACILDSGLVKDCIVYGEKDILGNEIVCADIIPAVPQIGGKEVRSYCWRHLTGYKQPQKITIVATIKKTATGKHERAVKENL